jgi:[acyl-carrier-protein] S-malonyltransferase
MPYTEDGETWSPDARHYEEGMSENKPGHRPLVDYKLPAWVNHPLVHPSSGIFIDNKDYAYTCTDPSSGTALDGIGNHMGYGVAHIAAMYGDMEILESCSPSELNARDVNGKTAAHFAAESGASWIMQWLVEKGCDTTSGALLQDKRLHSPQEVVYMNSRNHQKEIDWLDKALLGELTDKQSQEAQEYKLKRWRSESLDPIVEEFLDADATKLKQRYHFYRMGDFQMPYPMPTDEEVRAKLDLPTSRVPRPPAKSKPPLPVCLMFPGQGSQYLGMLKDCMSMPAVQALLKEANKILGWDLKDLALNGPEAKLAETKYCQPLMFVAGMAAVEVMKADAQKNEAVERVQAVAGLSLGEYTAICAAGILDFPSCLRLVKLRGEAMQKATELSPQAMCSVAGLDRQMVDKCCKEAIGKKLDKEPVCQVANVLFPAGFTVGGTKNTIDELCKIALKARALQAKVIKTGGAFHTPLMASAESELAAAIDSVSDKMQPPRCCIYFNVNAKKIAPGTDPSTFAAMMKKQLTSEVLWEPTMKQMIIDGVKDFYECGPLKQLKAMIKRIDQDAFKRTENISV